MARPLTEVLSASDGQGQADYLYGLGRIGSFGRETRTYASDVRGSLRATTDERGRVRGTRGYDAWGATDGEPGAEGRGADLAGIFGYTGERQDPASALVFLRARWYTPDTGRFLSRDPEPGRASDPRTLAPYAYAHNNPATLSDPSGRAPLFPDSLSFLFIADPCTGTLIPVPDIADQATKALFGENRVPSLLSQLIPTLACNEQSYVKPVTSPKPASCLAPTPGLQPGPVLPGLGGTVTPTFTFTSNPKAGTGCGPLGGVDGALYAKAAGAEPKSPPTESARRKGLPTLVIDARKLPNIAKNIRDALREGYPSELNRETDPAIIKANRRAACAGFVGCLSPDEYPFASTKQGGAGARVRGVPLSEQFIQGAQLANFYARYGIGPGDPFLVVVIGLGR